MFSLFWKIFLTFWATILVIELFTAWNTADLSNHQLDSVLMEQNAEFIASTTKAVSVLTSSGIPALNQWLKAEENLKGVEEIFVFDHTFKEINNKPVPDSIKLILDTEFNNPTPAENYQTLKHALFLKTVSPDGLEYLVVSTFNHPHLINYLLAPERVVLSILISGLICYLLALYFTYPLNKLRRYTHIIAMGVFSTSNLHIFHNRRDEFGQLAKDFERMAERLGEVLNGQRQLLRDISHELRSPLARIRVALELAHNKCEDRNIDELNRIEHEIERFESLIGEMLTLARIDRSNPVSSLSKVDVRELFGQVVNDVRFEQQKKREPSAISLQCPNNIDLSADAHLLHRAVENIVRNACYYSPPDTTINIQCRYDATNLYITVEDEGPGVPEDMLENIFKPFVRVSPARDTNSGGTGIGLAIAKRVVEIHNGTITAKNRATKEDPEKTGLIVTIILPLHNISPAEQAAAG